MSLRTTSADQNTDGNRRNRGEGQTRNVSESDAGEASEEIGQLADGEIFDVLRNSRRRAVIAHLLDASEPVTLQELTQRVAADEYGIPIEDVSSEQYKRVYTGLYQCHLPRLDDFGVIEFDRETKTVLSADAAAQVEPYLDREDDTPFVRAELGVAVVVASLVTLGVTGVGAFGLVPVTGWATLTVLTLLGISLGRLWQATA